MNNPWENLTPAAKKTIAIIVLIVAGIIAFTIFRQQPAVEETPSPGATIAPQPNPTPSTPTPPTQPITTPTPEPTTTSPHIPEPELLPSTPPPLPSPDPELTNTQWLWDAQDQTLEAINNYYTLVPYETPQERIQRLTSYFPEGSPYLYSTPIGNLSGFDPETNDDEWDITFSGTVNTEQTITITKTHYQTIYSIRVQFQASPSATNPEPTQSPMQIFDNELITVTSEHNGTRWEITSIIPHDTE